MNKTEILFQNTHGETFRVSLEKGDTLETIIKERESIGDKVIMIGTTSEVSRLTVNYPRHTEDLSTPTIWKK